MLRQSFRVTKPVARARVYASGLAYNAAHAQRRAPTSDSVLDPAFTELQRRPCSTRPRRDGARAAGRERHRRRSSARASSTTRRARGTGAGRRPSGARRRGCGSISASRTPTAPRRWSRRTARGRSARTVRRATTATTSARPTTRGARSPAGTEPGFDDSAWAGGARRRGAGRRGARRGARADPRSSAHARRARARARRRASIVYDIGQNLTGWAEVEVEAPAGTRDRDLLLREARPATAGPAPTATTSCSASCRPTTTSRAAGRRDLGAALQLQGLPVRPAQRRRVGSRCPTASR